ncbi:hypothetical protein D3C72_937430 [compost metagenome]
MAQRVVFLADHFALEHVLDMLAGNLVRGARPDVVRADQVERARLLLARQPVQAGQNLLRGLLAGIEDVLGLLQAFIKGRVIQQAVFFLEHRQDRLARGRGPAAEHGGDLVANQQFAGLFGKGRPVRGAVFLDDLDLAAQNAAHGIDLLDGQALGLNRPGFADGHGAGRRVQLAYRDFGVGNGQAGGVDGGSGRRGRARQRRYAQQRQGGKSQGQAPARGQFRSIIKRGFARHR